MLLLFFCQVTLFIQNLTSGRYKVVDCLAAPAVTALPWRWCNAVSQLLPGAAVQVADVGSLRHVTLRTVVHSTQVDDEVGVCAAAAWLILLQSPRHG